MVSIGAVAYDMPRGYAGTRVTLYRNVLEHAPESPDAKTGLEKALRAGADSAGLAAFLADRGSEGQSTFLGNLADSFRALTAAIEREFDAAAAREGFGRLEEAQSQLRAAGRPGDEASA